ncbi:hypothetical protein M501DRAFT_999153 [Patellaria atrata CBS 101060]|uniref:Uncharacterized protein n=1 Tax=Patellaria atrata CBS 101060 TaxID=1346257 RepID=A0A9P4S3I6_9PEZI|nr:hypothetical protein M501DRAFT_999153 [Patellaria atrata CBS 101060]
MKPTHSYREEVDPTKETGIEKEDLLDKSYESSNGLLLKTLNLYILKVIVQPFCARQEKPKIAFRHDRLVSLIRSSVHLAPIAGCAIIFSLNASPQFIGSDFLWISSLQYVATAHGLLMQASIAAVVLEYVRHEITFNENMPFGALFSALQVSHISYLWSLEFWASISASCLQGHRRILFASLVFFSLILAAVVGPSSAVAMIPRQRDFLFGSAIITFPYSRREMFPSQLTSEIANNSCLTAEFLGKELNSQCLLGSEWQTVLRYLEEENPGSVQSIGSATSRSLTFSRETDTMTATTQSLLVADALASWSKAWWQGVWVRMPADNDVMVKLKSRPPQPFVQTDCRPFIALQNSTSAIVRFGNTLNPTFASRLLLEADVWSMAQRSEGSRFIWEEPEVSSQNNFSVLAIVLFPKNWWPLPPSIPQPQFNTTPANGVVAAACSVRAAWASPADTILMSTSEQVLGSVNEFSFNHTKWTFTPSSVPSIVHISREWAKRIPAEGLNSPSVLRLAWSLDSIPMLSQKIISGLLAGGMAAYFPRRGTNIGATFRTQYTCAQGCRAGTVQIGAGSQYGNFTINNFRSDESFEMGVEVTAAGYAYNMDGVGVKIAISVLALYCAFALGFVCYALISGASSSCWDTVAEVTALALNSERPQVLKNTSTGIRTMATFRAPVSVRAHEDKGLQIIFEGEALKFPRHVSL